MAPLMGLVAIGRGGLVAGSGLLYVLFPIGALAGKTWAWWAGLIATLMNVFLVLSLKLQGAPRHALTGLGYRSGDPTLLPFQTLSVAH
jgi:hypothetical protein